jgi:hypothetical protein
MQMLLACGPHTGTSLNYSASVPLLESTVFWWGSRHKFLSWTLLVCFLQLLFLVYETLSSSLFGGISSNTGKGSWHKHYTQFFRMLSPFLPTILFKFLDLKL